MKMREYGKQREQETERRRLQAFRADLPEVSAWEPFGEKRLCAVSRMLVRQYNSTQTSAGCDFVTP